MHTTAKSVDIPRGVRRIGAPTMMMSMKIWMKRPTQCILRSEIWSRSCAKQPQKQRSGDPAVRAEAPSIAFHHTDRKSLG
ncbi:hypothetical protein DAPPUDRAFT_246922 [Daphnia pulex]|uniref:Uncharacterized protein n=1 Tax=Daphnia pulex TaxID=6669 RepID=E9GRG2_DAPPU|nr:hypothetical protein DAPPUDRAFT_246922 [Daphnia pulex]|eukprot:EFX77920.1 hypothetical protein DAPPUDRAFT_246922 [Daphnia pulex]